jgi:RNA polymerase sigma-54 factor
MEFKQRLEQRQVQKLILAPALQQAIKLLPLTNLELIEIIDTELSQNPMLELEEETEEKSTEKETQRSQEETKETEKAPTETQDQYKEDDLDVESYFQQYFDDGFPAYFSEKKEMPSLEGTLSRSPSLWDHLDWQANLTFFDRQEKEIAQLIIGNVNEDGYLTVSVEEIAETAAATVEKVNEIREKIKKFDPVGVASLDLKEALLAQMDYLEVKDKIAQEIVNEYLPLLEKSEYAQVAKSLGIPLSDLNHHIEVIKALNPTPGRKYAEEKTFYVVPDILVFKEGHELKITLNDEGMPRLKINNYYRNLLSKAGKDSPETHRFLKDKMKKALWFLRSLEQRNLTIYKVAKYIVDKQKEFIEKGMDYLKPLTLVELAQEIGVHESTVGRVVTNKYIMTPRGVFSLKFFFHKSLAGDYGEEISSLRVKEMIRKLIENEDKKHPLSDIEIGDILAKENFKIARRTVAKYRKQLKIPPSHIRKRRFLMEGT